MEHDAKEKLRNAVEACKDFLDIVSEYGIFAHVILLEKESETSASMDNGISLDSLVAYIVNFLVENKMIRKNIMQVILQKMILEEAKEGSQSFEATISDIERIFERKMK